MAGTTACDQGSLFSKVLIETCESVLQTRYPTCLDQNVPACCTSYISYALSELECVNSHLPGCADTDLAKSHYSTICASVVPNTSALTTSEVIATTTSEVKATTTSSATARPSGQSTGEAPRGTGLSLGTTLKAALLVGLFVLWL